MSFRKILFTTISACLFILCTQAQTQSALSVQNKRSTVLLDGYFNQETKFDSVTKKYVQFHYLWNEDDDNGYSIFGKIFNKYGVKTMFTSNEINADVLKQAGMYIIVDPDVTKENPQPHYINANDVSVITNWVKDGGVLLLLGNDSGNAEFTHFNTLATNFGIRFNEDCFNKVPGAEYEKGAIMINNNNPIFTATKKIYIKELSTLTLQSPANPVLTKEGKNIMAVAKFGKGTVFALGDPWLYNEYINGKKLSADYENYKAAEELVQWLISQ